MDFLALVAIWTNVFIRGPLFCHYVAMTKASKEQNSQQAMDVSSTLKHHLCIYFVGKKKHFTCLLNLKDASKHVLEALV